MFELRQDGREYFEGKTQCCFMAIFCEALGEILHDLDSGVEDFYDSDDDEFDVEEDGNIY